MYDYNDRSKEDDKWLYVHAFKRVRRINVFSQNKYFMGTDFIYIAFSETY